MAVSLYQYQLDAMNKMHNGCILCGTVGSGKSRTALAYYYTTYGGIVNTDKYVLMRNPPDLYIITTARKRDTNEWERELSPFYLFTNEDENILYTNKVVVDSWNNIKKYSNVKDAFFIFDEQRVVGYGAWARTFIKIAKANSWILLSATPGDTWSDYIPVFIANGYFRNKYEFESKHAVFVPGAKFPIISRYINTGYLEKCRRSILVMMNFSNKTEKHISNITTEYDVDKYKKVVMTRWNGYDNKPIESPGEFCFVLRRICNSDISRINKLLEIVKEHNKVIIFYNFNYELDILKSLNYGEGFEIAEWNGSTHNDIPESDKWVYLVQYVAGAEGWNCTQTDTMIFFSENYSYKLMKQAAGRIDRLNTPFNDLYYYHFRTNSKIDMAITAALRKKKNFNIKAFDQQEINILIERYKYKNGSSTQ